MTLSDTVRCLLLGTLSLLSTAGQAVPARFEWFDYRGVEPGPAPGVSQYRNPVLQGFYSDPSVVQVGRDYYLVTSSFGWFPGLPIFHSRDLVHWRQIGNAIDRPGQIEFGRIGMSQGLWAPDISYHNGRFYIVNTCSGCGGNFIITATRPEGPWSNPTWLKGVAGFDPSLFFDKDGSTWLVMHAPPEGGAKYFGHGAIWLQRFDPIKLEPIGEARMIVDGGVEPDKKPVWIEGPHIFRHDGRYYLTLAEGGTGVNHSQVIFAAETLEGPWKPAPLDREPILTQRDLDPMRPSPITSAGHADFVQADHGKWWALFHATRPYKDNLYNIGRETFLLPVTWRDGWPTILPPGQAIPMVAPDPNLRSSAAPPMSGSFEARDTFKGTALSPYWSMMRTSAENWFRIARGGIDLTPRPMPIGTLGQPSFIARRQQHADATWSTALTFDPAEGEAAGLAAVQNENFFLTEALTRIAGKLYVEVRRRAGESDPVNGTVVTRVSIAGPRVASLRLRVNARGGAYDFDYALDGGVWLPVAHEVDGTILSTEKAGGFVGTMIGPFALASPGP